MEDSILTAVVLPVSLAIIMLGMGMTIVTDDFKRVFLYPKAAFLGLTNQLIILPLIGFTLSIVCGLSPEMAVGIMIIACCPGGATSNLITHVSKGDIALSITLTAITNLITVFTIPIVLSYALVYFANHSSMEAIRLPVVKTIVQIMVITIIPVSIGMVIKKYKNDFALKMERPMRLASTVIFALVVIVIVVANKDSIFIFLRKIGWVVFALNITTMAIGYFSARLFRLNLKQTISITIDSGIQNGALAIVIATSILKHAEMSIPAAVYSLMMFFTSGVLMWHFGRRTTDL
ncbi:MAG: bile acid:sodium symporter family protein [Bacteroidetes bacterium]|nr:bile acid:sodium symporter family protein [Bacteroidota bacterium]